jgi:CHAD domain-containing protein
MSTSTDQRHVTDNDQLFMIIREADTPEHWDQQLARALAMDTPRRAKGAAAPVRAGDVVMAAVRAQVIQLRTQEHRIRHELPDSVTQMRVATRQLRSILTGYSRILDPHRTTTVAEELKWLGAQLAEEHDTEVMIERFNQVIQALPEDLIVGPLACDLEQALGQLAEQGEQTIITALNSPRYHTLHHLLDQLLTNPPLTHRAERPAHTELPKSLTKAVRRLNKRLTTAETLPEGTERDEALHEARKTDKQVRYMTEILIPIIGKPARRLHRHTKKLQNLLGDYQDAVIARPILKQLAATAHNNGHSAFTYGLLYAIEHNRMQHVLTQLPNRLQHLRDNKTLAWLTPTQHTLPTIPRHEWTPAGEPPPEFQASSIAG